MSTHFTIKYIVSYYIGLLLLCTHIYSYELYSMQQKGILYHVSLPQYYNYCVQLYIHYTLFIVFILTFI